MSCPLHWTSNPSPSCPCWTTDCSLSETTSALASAVPSGCDSAVERLGAHGVGGRELRDVDLLARPLLERARAHDVTELDDRLVDRDARGRVGDDDERPVPVGLRRDRQRRVAEFLGGDRRGLHDLGGRRDLTGEALHRSASCTAPLPAPRHRCGSLPRQTLTLPVLARKGSRTGQMLPRPARPADRSSPSPSPRPRRRWRRRGRALCPAPGPPVDLAAPSTSPSSSFRPARLPSLLARQWSRREGRPTSSSSSSRSRDARPRRRASTRPRSTSRSTPTRSIPPAPATGSVSSGATMSAVTTVSIPSVATVIAPPGVVSASASLDCPIGPRSPGLSTRMPT